MKKRVLCWFSCGAASAAAAKLAIQDFGKNEEYEVEVLYCDTLAFEHPDNARFLKDVEKWLGQEIKILRSEKYKDIFDVFDKTGWLVGLGGARCTTELKIVPRKKYQRPDDIHVFGFTNEERARADLYHQENLEETHFPLILHKVGKRGCLEMLMEAGIKLPEMYLLGYKNNNCIGCVKGTQGYWNKIRKDFPQAFSRMAAQERKMDVAINKSYAGDNKRKRIFLDELDPKAGRGMPEPNFECGVICGGEDDS